MRLVYSLLLVALATTASAYSQTGSLYFNGSTIATAEQSTDINSRASGYSVEFWLLPEKSGTILSWNTAGHGRVPYISVTHEGNVLVQEEFGSVLQSKQRVVFGQWNHVAMTFANPNWKLYVNGDLSASSTVSEFKFEARGGLTVGCRNTQTLHEGDTLSHYSDHLQGFIDEVRFWHKELSQNQIDELLAVNTVANHDPVLYWSFDNSTGSNVFDESGNGNTLILEDVLMNNTRSRPAVSSIALSDEAAYFWSVQRFGSSGEFVARILDGGAESSVALAHNGMEDTQISSAIAGIATQSQRVWEVSLENCGMVSFSVNFNSELSNREVFIFSATNDFSSVQSIVRGTTAGGGGTQLQAYVLNDGVSEKYYVTVAVLEDDLGVVSASEGFGPFTEGKVVENTLKVEVPAGVTQIAYQVASGDHVFTSGSQMGVDSLSFALDMGQLEPQTYILVTYSYSGFENAVTQVVPISIVQKSPTITSSAGWGPFVIGANTTSTITVTDLDDDVTSVAVRIVDVNNVPVVVRNTENEVLFDSLVVTGDPVTEVTWELSMSELRLPLSSKIAVTVLENTGNQYFTYYQPLRMISSPSWDTTRNLFGPFGTNAYTRNVDTKSEFPTVAQQKLSYRLLDIPPRTSHITFAFYNKDSVQIEKQDILRNPNLTAKSIKSDDFEVSELPLDTRYMSMTLFCDGGPAAGIGLLRDISVMPDTPHLYATAGWGPFQQRNERDTLDTGTFENTITVYPASVGADSVRYYWLQRNGTVFDSITRPVEQHGDEQYATLNYDMRSLPYHVDSLFATVFYPEGRANGISVGHNIAILAPRPLLTSRTDLTQQSSGQVVVNNIVLSSLPDRTDSVEISLFRGTELIKQEMTHSQPIPFRGYSRFGPDQAGSIEAGQLHHGNEVAVSVWLNTSSNKGGKIFGLQNAFGGAASHSDHNLYMDTAGHLIFGEQFADKVVVESEYPYNDGKWHHVTVSVMGAFEYSVLKLFVDGCQIGYKVVNHTKLSSEGYWQVGSGELSQWPGVVSSTNFDGYLADFAVFDGLVDAADAVKIMTVNAEGSSLQPVLYLPLVDINGGQTLNTVSQTLVPVKGGVRSVSTSELGHVSFTFPEKLEAGDHTLSAKVYYPLSVDTGHVYQLREFTVADSWHWAGDYIEYEIRSSAGFGWFIEGMETETELTIRYGPRFADDLNFYHAPSRDWDSITIVAYLQQPSDTTLTEHSRATIGFRVNDSLNLDTVRITMSLEDVEVGSKLVIGYENHALTTEFGEPTWIVGETAIPSSEYSLWVRPLIPPVVRGHFGTYTQAICPGTMAEYETYDIYSSADDVVFLLEGFDGIAKTVRAGEMSSVGFNHYQLKVNMAELPANTSEVYINTYSGDTTELLAQNGPHKITINPTRPEWFNYVDRYSEQRQENDSVWFVASAKINPLSAASTSEDITGTSFQIPTWFPVIANQVVDFFPADVAVPMVYSIEEDDLELREFESPYVETGLHLFGVTLDGRHELFNLQDSNFMYLDDDGNFWAWQRTIDNLGANIPVKSSYDGLERLYKVIHESEELEDADIVGPTASIGFQVGGVRGSNVHLGMNDNNAWGSIGDLEISDYAAETSSYETLSLTLGLNASFGIEALFGVAEADFIFSADGEVGLGYSYHQLPSDATKTLKSANVHLYGQAQIKVLWGAYTKTVWGPETFYYHHWGDNIPQWWPSPSTGWLGAKKQGGSGSIASVTNNQFVGKLPIATVFPHSEILRTSAGASLFWLDQDPISGLNSLKYMDWNTWDSTYSEPREIVSNRNGMNAVETAEHGSVIVATWSQGRMEPEDIHDNMSVAEMLSSQDIHVAVAEKGTDVQLLMVADDMSSLHSGRIEGAPKVAHLTKDTFMIVWVVAFPESSTSEIWGARVYREGDSWNVSEPAMFANPGGVQRNLRIRHVRDHAVAISWMNGIALTNEQSRIVSLMYDQGELVGPTTVFQSTPTSAANSFDVDFSENTGVALVLKSEFHDGIVEQLVTVYNLNEGATEWQEVFSSVVDGYAQYPQIAVSTTGIIAGAFVVPSQDIAASHRSDVHILTSSEDHLQEWNYVVNAQGANDPEKRIAEFDMEFVTGDLLFLISQELEGAELNTSSSDGRKSIGLTHMDQVLRVLCIQDDRVLDVDEETFQKVVSDTEEEPRVSNGVSLVHVFPNPTSEEVMVECVTGSAILNIDIIDLRGVVVSSYRGDERTMVRRVNLNIGDIPVGNYTVRVTTEKDVLSTNVIIYR